MTLTRRIFRGHMSPAAVTGLAMALTISVAQAQDFAQNSAAPSGAIAPGTMSFQNSPVTAVLDTYAQLSGKHLILDANLTGVPPVSINADGLSKSDKLSFIESALLLNGVSLIPVDENTVKVVTIGTNKNPRSEGVKLFSSEAELPSDEQVISFYMPLNYLNPQEAVGVFTQTAPVHTYGAYVPAPSSQAVVLTENLSVIRQLIALKKLIDVPPARVASEWVQLNRADSDKVADLLLKMLGQSPTGAPAAAAGPGGQVFVPPDLGNRAPLSNEKNLISGTATIISDPRSNRVLLVSRPVNMAFLEQMIAQLDQPDIFMVPQRRPLRYVSAADILPAIETALAQGKDELDKAAKDQQAAQSQSQGQGRAGSGGGGNPAPVSNQGGSSGGGSSVANITPQLQSPSENLVPTVIVIGKTRIMADNRSNSIIVFGSPDVTSRVFEMIDQLDRKPLQVYLATVIGQLTVREGVEFGIDILQKFQKVGQGGLATGNINSGRGATGFPDPRALSAPATATSGLSTLFPTAAGLTIYGAIGSTLDAYVRALETTNRFKIISRPSVYTTNNKLAVIASGSQVPVPSNITSGFSGTASDLTTTASVVYEDVLLQLNIIPLINAHHEVTLKIRQTNNTLGNNVSISGNNVPIINTQEINTEVTVPDRSTVVIGGLITDNTTRDSSGVPFLSDIPILGYLFSDTSKTKERDELIIMIQPTVVETDADQIAANEAEKQRTILGREAVEAATGVPAAQQSAVLPVTPPLQQTTVQTTTTTDRGNSPYSSKTGRKTKAITTTTTVQRMPSQQLTPVGPTSPIGPVPALSSPAPDVGNGKLPTVNPPTATPPPTQTP